MDNSLLEQREILRRILDGARSRPSPGIGLVQTVEYRGVCFHVTRRFVIADLAPLSFFHLVEPIYKERGDSAEAILELYDRLAPLLSCRHRWTVLKRQSDGRIRNLGTGNTGPHICKLCMAYALGGQLPAVGNSLP